MKTPSHRILSTAALLVVAVECRLPPAFAQTEAEWAAARRQMVREAFVGSGVTDSRVLRSMENTPRHEFIPRAQRRMAYYDMGLPIGYKQTISAPFIVAYMTQSIDPQPTDKVLEIGTGSGYQAAVLSPLVAKVYTIEIVEPLGLRAARTLRHLGYKNVLVKIGDGFQGWPEHAPFDKIIVTCSPENVPDPLVAQLKEGGRMVIPVGERFQQTLYLFRKQDGKLRAEALRPTLFVPMTGKAAADRKVQPDPRRPELVNGTFEAEPGKNGLIPNWYYQRQVRWVTDPGAPEGEHYATFRNRDPGRISSLLQGFAIDGRTVAHLALSATIKAKEVTQGPARNMLPVVAVSFYDENHRDLGRSWIGPYQGTFDWREVSGKIRVPAAACYGVLRTGLLGATGELSVDQVRIKALPR